jgi:hypothetical protein
VIQKFIVVFNHAFQIFHALAHRLHGLETLVDRCVELRDGVTASRTTHRMRPERVCHCQGRRRRRRRRCCRMDLPGPTTSVGTRTDYSVGPWDYLTCAARYLMA